MMHISKKIIAKLLCCLLFIILCTGILYITPAKDFSLTILHTNDSHGTISHEPYLKTLAENLSKNGEEVLIMSAGDIFHGQLIASLSKGSSVVKIMNATGFNYIVPGNHDFNYGLLGLKNIERQANFKIVNANITNKSDGKNVFAPYDIKIINGVKVGIFGITTPETLIKSSSVDSISKLNFDSPVDTAKKIIAQLKEQNCKIIIALTHLGLYDYSDPTMKSDYLAENAPGIDLIIDGHSHTVLKNGLQVKNTLIAQAGEYGKNIGVVNITLKDDVVNKNAYLVNLEENPQIEPNSKILQIVENENKKIEDIISEEVCTTNFYLDGERKNVRTRETNLADLITDSIFYKTNADLTIMNGGTIRDSLEAGTITKGDILKVLPFTNLVVTIKAKGSTILEALEHGVSQYPESFGGNIQVAGINFKFDPKQKEGEKVFDVRFIKNNELLDANRYYKLALNQFMLDGGDGYDMFSEYEEYEKYESIETTLIDYLTSQKNIDIYSSPQNRIQIQNKSEVEQKIKIYKIKKGDTLYRIGKKFGTTWQKLAAINSIKNPDLIFPNDIIFIY